MTSWRERFPWTAAALRFLWVDARRRRRIAVLLAAGVLGLLAAHAVLDVWAAERLGSAAERIARRRGPLELAGALGPANVSAEENRTKALRAAADLLVLDDDETRGPRADTSLIGRLAQFDSGEPDDVTWTRLAAILEKNAIALELLDEAARRPGSNWEIRYRDGVSAEVPPLLGLLNLGKLNVAAGRLELRRGHTDAAVEGALRGLALAESFRAEPILIVQMVRGSLFRIHLGLVREILQRDAPGRERLAGLSAALDGIEIRRPLEEAVVWEMRAMRDALLTADTCRFGGGERPWIARAPVRWLVRPWIHENLRHYLVTMDRFASRAAVPPYRRATDATASSEDDAGWLHALARISMVNSQSMIERGDVWESALVLARTALALERRREARGAYPDRLDELVPGELDSPLLDPFTGELPRYARNDGGYTLSSGGAEVEARAVLGPTRLLRWEKRTGPEPAAEAAVAPCPPGHIPWHLAQSSSIANARSPS